MKTKSKILIILFLISNFVLAHDEYKTGKMAIDE